MESVTTLTEARSREFAIEYRNLVLFYGGQLGLSAISITARLIGPGVASEVLRTLVSLGVLGSTTALVYLGYRTARAMGSAVPWAWALGLLMPCVNIVTLIFLSRRATDICNAAGIPMGFLGPQPVKPTGLSQNREAAQQGDEADEPRAYWRLAA
jgi:hypothetical protein